MKEWISVARRICEMRPTPEVALKETLREALLLASAQLGTEFASVTRVHDTDCEVICQISPPASSHEGLSQSQLHWLGRQTLERCEQGMFGSMLSGDVTVALGSRAARPFRYLSVPVRAHDRDRAAPDFVLSFWSARERPASAALMDTEFVWLVGAWIGGAIERVEMQGFDLEVRPVTQLAAIQAKAKACDSYLAAASHEMRTPLNTIILAKDLMARGNLPIEQQGYLAQIQVAAQHLLEVTHTMLSISALDPSRVVTRSVLFKIESVMQEVVSLLRERIGAKNLRVALEVKQVPAIVRGDPTRLRQALLNFGTNAVKATTHGLITFRAMLLESTNSHFEVRFEVEDTGCGMGDQAMTTLFQENHRIDRDETACDISSGLGLAITKRLVDSLGGRVGATSRHGQGSIFWLTATFERANPGQPVCGDAEFLLATRYAGASVLLVEDDTEAAALIRDLLGFGNLSVDLANGGGEAQKMALENDYDVILIDLWLTDMRGVEAIRHIREIPGYRHTPVIAMTGDESEVARADCLAEGISVIVPKPVDANLLFASILDSLLCKSRLQHSAA